MDDLNLQQLKKMYEMQRTLHGWQPHTSAEGQVKYSGPFFTINWLWEIQPREIVITVTRRISDI